MTERNFCASLLYRDVVEDAATQSGTERAGRFAFRHYRFDYRVCVTFDDSKWHFQVAEVFGQYVFGKVWLLLIEVDREQLKRNQNACHLPAQRLPASIQEFD